MAVEHTKFYTRSRLYHIGGVLFFGVACFFVGYLVGPTRTTLPRVVREHTDQYTFISPLLAISRPSPSNPTEGYKTLSKAVSSYISDQEKKKKIESASVYLINYTQEGSFAINETEAYNPASLMKVVIMMTYFKKAENNPSFLNKKLLYTDLFDQVLRRDTYDTPSSLTVGESYTITSLIRSMIVDSDNGAMNTLLANISDDLMTETYVALGITAPEEGKEYHISAKDYAFFFRVLYNATYLSREYSEQALSILSQATYSDGLVAGLPGGTVVAHKFGQHVNAVDGKINSIELHDCGIVYEKNDRYLLCIMTKGKDATDLSNDIATITKMVSTGR